MGIEKVQMGWRMWKRNGKGEERMENGQKDEGSSGTRMGQRAWSRCQLDRAGVLGMGQMGMGRERTEELGQVWMEWGTYTWDGERDWSRC